MKKKLLQPNLTKRVFHEFIKRAPIIYYFYWKKWGSLEKEPTHSASEVFIIIIAIVLMLLIVPMIYMEMM